MKLAILGSRCLQITGLEKYVPTGITEIISGGAKEVDSCAKVYAQTHKIKLTEFFPDYAHYKKAAPLYRNIQIVDYADEVLVFWDGTSRGTKHVIEVCEEKNKKVTVIKIEKSNV